MVEVWFAILTVMLGTFAVLDGLNIGCGIVSYAVARSPLERRVVVGALGPLWSWHEVWLLSAGGILFVAFPSVLATALSGFYLAVFLLLWCLLLRGLSLELSGHMDDPMWRAFWDVLFAVSSVLLGVLLGAALGNVVRGVPLDARGRFSLAFFTDFGVTGDVGILDWYTVSVAVFTVACLAAHGATYLVLKTEGVVHQRSLALARRLWPGVFLLLAALSVETNVVRPELFAGLARRPLAWLLIAVVVGGTAAIVDGARRGREVQAFLGSCAFIVGLLAAGAVATFPVMLHSTFPDAPPTTAYDGAAAAHGLGLALLWWPAALALALVYASFVFRHFSGKVRASA